MITFFDSSPVTGIFNIYADPSQVYDWEPFFECMSMTKNLKNTSFDDLITSI